MKFLGCCFLRWERSQAREAPRGPWGLFPFVGRAGAFHAREQILWPGACRAFLSQKHCSKEEPAEITCRSFSLSGLQPPGITGMEFSLRFPSCEPPASPPPLRDGTESRGGGREPAWHTSVDSSTWPKMLLFPASVQCVKETHRRLQALWGQARGREKVALLLCTWGRLSHCELVALCLCVCVGGEEALSRPSLKGRGGQVKARGS